MKKKQHPWRGLTAILLAVTAVILLNKHFHIDDFCVIEPSVLYTSGQPRGMDYTRLLYNYHIATIVNVRSASEHRERNWHNEEIIWTRNNGVNYIEMPLEKNNYFPNKRIQDQFSVIMADKNNLPVLVHGGGDDERVAMLTAVWLRQSQGCGPEETAKAVRKIIDDRELTKEEKNFIRLLSN
jgi:protein tyrosine/serine phosphatase